MKKLFSGLFFLSGLAGASTLQAQVAPSIEWQKSFGGSEIDQPSFIQQTSDGGFIVAGFTYSDDGDVSGKHGTSFYADFWIIKLDVDGNLVWQKTLGGTLHDDGYSVRQTTDGGYMVAGWTGSNDGDVTGNHGNTDFWLVKLDANGNLVGQKCFGGSSAEFAYSIQQTTDGGFIVAGGSASSDSDVSENNGSYDYWIVRLDSGENIMWQKSFGGVEYDIASSVEQTTDGGFIVAGHASSGDGDVTGHHGCTNSYDECLDYWIIKLDEDGNLIWEKSLGGSGSDIATSIEQTFDGGFIISGASDSYDGDVSGNHSVYNQYTTPDDYWIVKLDGDGNLVWQKCLGGSDYENSTSVQQTSDSGFIVAGYAFSNDADVSGNHGNHDYWVLKLNTDGNLEWQECLGGIDGERAFCIRQTTDGGFVVAGYSNSNDSLVSGNHGSLDYWIVKLSSDIFTGIAAPSTNFISYYPNPVQTQLTIDLAIPTREATIRVYDLQGRMIALPTTFTNTQAQLNTEKLQDGFYTLEIINNKTGEHSVANFVKQ